MAFTTYRQAGHERRLYYNTATHAAPSWTLVRNSRNVRVSAGEADADVSERASAHDATRPGRRSKELTFEWVYGTTDSSDLDTLLTALLASYNSGTVYEWFDADGPLANNPRGWRMCGYVSSMEKSEDDNEGTVYTITVKYTDIYESGSIVSPDWYAYS